MGLFLFHSDHTVIIYLHIGKYFCFFPVTSQTLENCSPEVRNAVIQILNKPQPEPEPTTVPDATPSTSGASYDPVIMPAVQGPKPGNILPITLLFGDWFY